MTKQNDKLDEILAGVNEGKEESRKTREMVTEMMAMMMQRKPNAQIGATAQIKAVETWRRYRYEAGIGSKGKKNSHANVFTFCRHELFAYGIFDANAFSIAVKNGLRNERRRQMRIK